MSETRTPLDHLADDYVDSMAKLSPMLATNLGVDGDHTALDDLSPAGLAAVAEKTRSTLRAVEAIEIHGENDAVTKAAMLERLGLEVELYDAGEALANLNNIASPLQDVRMVFDMMPTETTENWATIASRMSNVGEAIDGYIESLRAAHDNPTGPFPAIRQVRIGIAQAQELAAADSFWAKLAASKEAPDELRSSLEQGAKVAAAGYGRLAEALKTMTDRAPIADGVGLERYQRFSRQFLGATVDLDETYEWGRDELARIVAEQKATARELYGPGVSPEEAMDRLDKDPARQLNGTEALQKWMQATADAAVEALAGRHFDIADELRGLECCIAPTTDGGIYYTGPSADFSRPGRMWWAVPPGVTEFATWRELTTVYHEGVPGHHLQIGQATYRAKDLNKWRSLLCWVSGHGEGWALYSERLMADLGFLDDPGDRMGMLDAQRLRAARVVLDIGVHLGKECPQEWGGGTWDADKAWPFLKANVNMAEGFVKFELERYLGWPGQAPSYKVGQRLWEQARDETAAREGAAFDIKDFHARALDLGSLGLDVLRGALSAPTA